MAPAMRLTIEALRRRWSRPHNRAVAAVEFGLLAPTFVMVFAGTVTVGDAISVQLRLDGAVAAGINYAIVNENLAESTDGQTLASAIANLVSTSAGGTAANVTVVVNNGPTATITSGTLTTTGTATNADLFYCLTGSPSGWTWGTGVSTIGGACTGGGTYGKFVTITASYSFTPFFTAYTFGLGTTLTIGSAGQVQ
jgi:Flp pilus assembly protein TadG